MEVYYKETDLMPSESLSACRMRVKRESSFIRELMNLCDRHCMRCAPLEALDARAPAPRAPGLELPSASSSRDFSTRAPG